MPSTRLLVLTFASGRLTTSIRPTIIAFTTATILLGSVGGCKIAEKKYPPSNFNTNSQPKTSDNAENFPPREKRQSALESKPNKDALEHFGSNSPPALEEASTQREHWTGIARGIHYDEMITGNAKSSDTLPMIVAIHGLGDSPQGFAQLLKDLPIESRVILPRGFDRYDGTFGQGWSWFPFRARDPDVEALSNGIHQASKAIADGVRELSKRYPTLGKPIVTGFSQGGMLSFDLAVEFPELFSTVIPISGWLPPPLWPYTFDRSRFHPRIIALHGNSDPAVKIEPTRSAVSHLDDLGFDVKLQEFAQVQHEIPQSVRVELFRLLLEYLPTK